MTTAPNTLTARALAAYDAHVAADLTTRAQNDLRDRADTTSMLHDVLLGKFGIDAHPDTITWHPGPYAFAAWLCDGIEFRVPIDGDANQLTWILRCSACGGQSRAVGSLGPDSTAHGLAVLGAWLRAPIEDRCADCGKAISATACADPSEAPAGPAAPAAGEGVTP